MATTKALVLKFSDGAVPEVFSIKCSINTNRSFKIDTSMVEAAAPNCDNLDAPSWTLRSPDTNSADISGAGTMDPISFGFFRAKQLAGESMKTRVSLEIPLAQGGGYYEGFFVISSLEISKEGKGYVQFTVSLQSDGEITWTNAAA